uniref:Uncharacterized protein n=1 Tax=Erythrolobus australicus TaxID=1077150 RepID=A0A7S1TLU7_9RHOD
MVRGVSALGLVLTAVGLHLAACELEAQPQLTHSPEAEILVLMHETFFTPNSAPGVFLELAPDENAAAGVSVTKLMAEHLAWRGVRLTPSDASVQSGASEQLQEAPIKIALCKSRELEFVTANKLHLDSVQSCDTTQHVMQRLGFARADVVVVERDAPHAAAALAAVDLDRTSVQLVVLRHQQSEADARECRHVLDQAQFCVAGRFSGAVFFVPQGSHHCAQPFGRLTAAEVVRKALSRPDAVANTPSAEGSLEAGARDTRSALPIRSQQAQAYEARRDAFRSVVPDAQKDFDDKTKRIESIEMSQSRESRGSDRELVYTEPAESREQLQASVADIFFNEQHRAQHDESSRAGKSTVEARDGAVQRRDGARQGALSDSRSRTSSGENAAHWSGEGDIDDGKVAALTRALDQHDAIIARLDEAAGALRNGDDDVQTRRPPSSVHVAQQLRRSANEVRRLVSDLSTARAGDRRRMKIMRTVLDNADARLRETYDVIEQLARAGSEFSAASQHEPWIRDAQSSDPHDTESEQSAKFDARMRELSSELMEARNSLNINGWVRASAENMLGPEQLEKFESEVGELEHDLTRAVSQMVGSREALSAKEAGAQVLHVFITAVLFVVVARAALLARRRMESRRILRVLISMDVATIVIAFSAQVLCGISVELAAAADKESSVRFAMAVLYHAMWTAAVGLKLLAFWRLRPSAKLSKRQALCRWLAVVAALVLSSDLYRTYLLWAREEFSAFEHLRLGLAYGVSLVIVSKNVAQNEERKVQFEHSTNVTEAADLPDLFAVKSASITATDGSSEDEEFFDLESQTYYPGAEMDPDDNESNTSESDIAGKEDADELVNSSEDESCTESDLSESANRSQLRSL